MFNLAIGLLAVMFANVIMGTTLAKLQDNFSKKKFWEGFVKVGGVIISVLLMYYCSYLNEDIMVASINGTNVTLRDAMDILFTAGIVFYGSQDLIKLKDILKLKTDINNIQKEETIQVPKKNIIEVGDE